MGENVFSERLKYLLDKRGWTQGKLASRAGVQQSNISMHLTGSREKPSLEFAYKVARALGASLDWLTGLKEQALDKLPPDEQDLLLYYRAIPDARSRRMALLSVKVHADVEVLEAPEIIDRGSEG